MFFLFFLVWALVNLNEFSIFQQNLYFEWILIFKRISNLNVQILNKNQNLKNFNFWTNFEMWTYLKSEQILEYEWISKFERISNIERILEFEKKIQI
jgi:hypothetical protein